MPCLARGKLKTDAINILHTFFEFSAIFSCSDREILELIGGIGKHKFGGVNNTFEGFFIVGIERLSTATRFHLNLWSIRIWWSES
jgi:hypothetical protein